MRQPAFHFPNLVDESVVHNFWALSSLPAAWWKPPLGLPAASADDGHALAWPAWNWLLWGPQWSQAWLQAQAEWVGNARDLALKMSHSALPVAAPVSNGHVRTPQASWTEPQADLQVGLPWNDWQSLAKQWNEWLLQLQPFMQEEEDGHAAQAAGRPKAVPALAGKRLEPLPPRAHRGAKLAAKAQSEQEA